MCASWAKPKFGISIELPLECCNADTHSYIQRMFICNSTGVDKRGPKAAIGGSGGGEVPPSLLRVIGALKPSKTRRIKTEPN